MIEAVPAIDIIAGRAVRLKEGRFDSTTDYGLDPLDVARRYRDAGLKRVHVVDLDGAKAGHIVHGDLVERIAAESGLAVDFGGGLRTIEAIEQAFALGIAQVNLGSAAIRDPDLIGRTIDRFGADRVILAADVRDSKIATHGWQSQTDIGIADLIARLLPAGLHWVMCTDIAKDGMLAGPAVELYRKLTAEFPQIGLIASGGVSSIADVAALDGLGLPRVVIGKALFEGHVSLEELRPYAG